MSDDAVPRDAVLGDWGTTRLRLFRVADGAIVDRLDGPGIGRLAGSPADALAETLAGWAPDRVTLCGMAGSRNGLVEAPYAACPVDAAGWATATAETMVGSIAVAVAAGLSCANFAGRADVMRGEETQIFGAAALDSALGEGRALVVLPGTHSKWAELVDGRVERFHTFLTGELFALLRDHSTLTRAGADPEGRDEGFEAGLARVRDPGGLLSALFEARAAQLLEARTQGWALGLLSGLAIGTEVADGLAMLGGETPARAVLIGDPALAALYERAFAAHGLTIARLDGDACSIAGLTRLAQLQETRG